MNAAKNTTELFPFGMVVMTTGAASLLQKHRVGALELIKRHQSGDWGELCPEDCKLNDDAVKYGERILSAYHLGIGRIWVIIRN